MSGFELDTSGVVAFSHEMATRNGWRIHTRWTDLDPFTQGYIEALFVGSFRDGTHAVLPSHMQGDSVRMWRVGFSDLSPEALALILRDCEAYRRQYVLPWYDGAEFWRGRQSGEIPARFFPPLSVTLGDDGKVRVSPLPTDGGE